MNLGNVRLCMYIMCLFIFEEKVEILDQNTLSLNPDQKVVDPILGSRQKYWAIDHGAQTIGNEQQMYGLVFLMAKKNVT